MAPSRAARLAVALAAGAAAGAAMWAREAPIEPFLEWKVLRETQSEHQELWGIRVTARGGETIDEVRAETDVPWLAVLPPGYVGSLRSGWKTTFRIQLDRDAAAGATGSVRLVQTGRVSRTYPVELVEAW